MKEVGLIVFFSLMYRHSNLILNSLLRALTAGDYCLYSGFCLPVKVPISDPSRIRRLAILSSRSLNNEFDMVGGELIAPPPQVSI